MSPDKLIERIKNRTQKNKTYNNQNYLVEEPIVRQVSTITNRNKNNIDIRRSDYSALVDVVNNMKLAQKKFEQRLRSESSPIYRFTNKSKSFLSKKNFRKTNSKPNDR